MMLPFSADSMRALTCLAGLCAMLSVGVKEIMCEYKEKKRCGEGGEMEDQEPLNLPCLHSNK